MRTILFAGAVLTGVALAAPGPLSPSVASAAALALPVVDDVPPKDDEKKDQVTVWVLEASGKG